ncbi:MAG: Rieske 2Fe-2S domain-containing protein [Meiothermus sp.]|uniref:QcrA and Rieske domain-containing protein n=1 Tax=Meiothermus sp. TaxID=1955249 RepID=UPI0025E5694E|nr:Rieske 2Fe-2S domain-containing protein [Meiothermus sp.]MCS7069547.1 Rieske 2Fe-2S domain-containing protein [Meiothermus sp.]
MNRREASKAILGSALALAGGQGLSQPVPPAVRIAAPSRLSEVWADVGFQFAGQPALLVRVPPPSQPNPRVFMLAQQMYFTAYSRVCTYLGCTVPLPDREQNIECGCHGSRFRADGSLEKGPADRPLRAIRLELREGAVWAVGWLDN